MYIHYFLKTVHENTKQSKQQLTLWARFVKCWFDQSAKPFYYNISCNNYTLD